MKWRNAASVGLFASGPFSTPDLNISLRENPRYRVRKPFETLQPTKKQYMAARSVRHANECTRSTGMGMKDSKVVQSVCNFMAFSEDSRCPAAHLCPRSIRSPSLCVPALCTAHLMRSCLLNASVSYAPPNHNRRPSVQIIPSSLLPLPLLCSRPGSGSLFYVSFAVSQSRSFSATFWTGTRPRK